MWRRRKVCCVQKSGDVIIGYLDTKGADVASRVLGKKIIGYVRKFSIPFVLLESGGFHCDNYNHYELVGWEFIDD